MKTLLHTLRLPALLSVAVACTLAAPAAQVSAKYSMPVQVKGKVTSIGCQNSGGPTITLEGELILGGVTADLILQNNAKGTHKTTIQTWGTNVVLIPLGEAITLPKQPVLGGVGGNPHIWIQFHDGAGHNKTEEIYLGRCVQGLEISPEFLHEVVALADVTALGCSNHPGPTISVGGTVTFSGLHARFIFRNNLRGTHTAQAVRDVELIVNGSATTIPKQPSQGGVGGNPIISIQFGDGEGDPFGDPFRLGRCTQL